MIHPAGVASSTKRKASCQTDKEAVMQFIKPGININFIVKRKVAVAVSVIFIVISIGSLLLKNGPRYGVDFAGGTLIQVKFEAATDIDKIKSGLATMDLTDVTVQSFGETGSNEYLIRTDASQGGGSGFSDEVKAALDAATGNSAEVRRVEMVGP
jgi:preprotein translocase subunit SecF